MREKIKNLEEFRALQEKFIQAREHEKRKVLVCCGYLNERLSLYVRYTTAAAITVSARIFMIVSCAVNSIGCSYISLFVRFPKFLLKSM